jgi:RNA ligase (TIGR02306 family)
MSSLILEVSKIRDIIPHNNADSLEIIQVYAWYVCARKGQYQKNQEVIYLPPDSVLSEEFEAKLFPPESKVKLHKRRIKSIKLRGSLSQGMIVSPEEFSLEYVKANVTKYEPPESETPSALRGNQPKKERLNDNFRKYVDIENWKYYDRVIQDGEQVAISLKMHGTSSRFANLKITKMTLWKKVKQLLGLLDTHEFCYGSRNVQLSDGTKFEYKNEKQGVDMPNVYKFVANKYMLDKIIPKDFGLYGEIVGRHIQKDYHYNVKENDYDFYIYDIYNFNEKRWLNNDEFAKMFFELKTSLRELTREKIKLYMCPALYIGPYSKEVVEQYRNGKDPIQTDIEREGIVVKPLVERSSPSLGRVILKCISDGYWLGKQSDFH